MDRTPAVDGAPGCWGRKRNNLKCDECGWRKRCGKATLALKERETVAEAVRRLRPKPDGCDLGPDELATFAQGLFVKQGGQRPWKAWSANRQFTDAMEGVLRVCGSAGWDARQYVRAQIESMTPMIDKGFPLKPGHFTGEKADARFDRWVVRYRRRHGDPRSRLQDHAASRRLAAGAAYAFARLLGGATHEVAREDAVSMYPKWRQKDMTDFERVSALSSALTALDPTLPHAVTLPVERWTWADAAALVDHARSISKQEVAPASSSTMGEFL